MYLGQIDAASCVMQLPDGTAKHGEICGCATVQPLPQSHRGIVEDEGLKLRTDENRNRRALRRPHAGHHDLSGGKRHPIRRFDPSYDPGIRQLDVDRASHPSDRGALHIEAGSSTGFGRPLEGSINPGVGTYHRAEPSRCGGGHLPFPKWLER